MRVLLGLGLGGVGGAAYNLSLKDMARLFEELVCHGDCQGRGQWLRCGFPIVKPSVCIVSGWRAVDGQAGKASRV